MKVRSFNLAVAAATFSSRALAMPTSGSSLPVVDLGYELHQALSYNETSEIYTFSNIRYAQSPTGNLRFRAPSYPLADRSTVRNGSEPRTCPQGIPAWQSKAFVPIDEFSTRGAPFNLSAWERAIEDAPALPIDTTQGTTEDCLFLDVHVPKKIWERAQRQPEGGFHGVPVLVWVHGGGFVLGSKTGFPQPTYNPDLIMQKGQQYSKDGFIFVALNYRLGAFGFLSGPAVLQDGDQNAGLLDQRFAFEWVQRNIHLFGGAPDRVTAMGESGGGGSILALMVGPGVKAPFSQVIAQSPAMNPTIVAPAGAFDEFLTRLNVSSLAEARKLDSTAVIRANSEQIGDAPPTSYVFGMVKDAKSMPAHLDVLLRRGDFDKAVRVLSAVDTLEGGFFFDPAAKTDDAVRKVIATTMPGMSASQLDELSNQIYPSLFDGSQGYIDQSSRQITINGDAYFYCNFLAVNEASNGAAHAYEFAVTPGVHTQDLAYTFDDPYSPPALAQARETLVSAITSFAVYGRPDLVVDGNKMHFPSWGANKQQVTIGDKGSAVTRSTVSEKRCAWWRALHESM
ncbi:acetylcholinesterase [Cordyceps javanica]|uniref:Acetylcholinesterase n=1 Tax=Cordyceps javanica TaxID=43265 RepID=A0A545W9I5_9HYPO|nr:acetylcholinesterase [Cordyceps javanica]TQW10535.1 acetylcholinesterase [Cordyceps javanica]